jgi:hypothetical protein
MRSGTVAAAFLCSVSCGWAADSSVAGSPAPDLSTSGQATSATPRQPAPDLLIRGQLILTPQQRQQIREAIEQTKVEEQPVPRAFAPAVGQTAPPELKLSPVPEQLEQVSGVARQHQFARLERGTILIVGEERLVIGMMSPGEGGAGATPLLQR